MRFLYKTVVEQIAHYESRFILIANVGDKDG